MNLLPKFHELLREANEAVDAVDAFDVVSSNPESKKEWDRLLQEAFSAKERLISYIKEHSEELVPQLSKLAGVS